MRNIDKFERYLRGKKWTPLSEYYSSNAFNKLNSQRKIIFFIVPIVVIWNSQYWNIKKCLKCWPYFSCTSKCECIFFFRSNKVLQRTSSHHCQSGGVRARQVVCDIGHFPPVSRQEQRKPASTPWNFFFLSRELSYIHSERFLIIFFYAVLVFPV